MIYIYDGTKKGFLTAFLQAFNDENAQVSTGDTQLHLGEVHFVKTDETRADKALERLALFDSDYPYQLDRLLRAGGEDSAQIAFHYSRYLAKMKRRVSERLAVQEVFKAVQVIKKVNLEIHHFHGFIRFMECESGALYAPFSPDNDICDLLLPHFRARLPEYPFVLHDVKRRKAAVYDGSNSFVAPLEQAEVLLSADENDWQALFKRYYNAVNIPSRERIKQMKGYMPVRYWKFMPETLDKIKNE